MNRQSRPAKSGSTKEDRLFLPSFCDIPMVFAVVVIAELLALVLVLAGGHGGDPWSQLGMLSLFVQWVALTSAAVLCGLRPVLSRFSNTAAATTSYLLLLLVTAALSELAFQAIETGLVYPQTEIRRTGFLLRNLGISAIISALVLRYLYVTHQWRQQAEAEALARVEALRARIRPHFLFNSLNTIAALTASRPAVAEEAIQDLADLFRATLAEANDRVTLQEEVSITRQYVQLESLRLGDRLDVDWELIDVPYRARVPALILQPLVENAIYHGVEPLPEGGVIRVWARVQDDELIVQVSNPMPSSGDYGRHQGNRIAQDNIRQRLALAFGSQASLQTRQKEGRYEVELRFPVERTF